MRGWFSTPVPVWLGQSGSIQYNVSNAAQASRLLKDEWPEDDESTLRDKAELACRAAIDGKDAEKARRAFERAAREAGILAG